MAAKRSPPSSIIRSGFLEMLQILFVLTEHFENVTVGHEVVKNPDRKFLRVELRIVECQFIVQVSEVTPVETLRHVHCFTPWMPNEVDRRFAVEPACLDDERVALPAPHGVLGLRKPGAIGNILPAL